MGGQFHEGHDERQVEPIQSTCLCRAGERASEGPLLFCLRWMREQSAARSLQSYTAWSPLLPISSFPRDLFRSPSPQAAACCTATVLRGSGWSPCVWIASSRTACVDRFTRSVWIGPWHRTFLRLVLACHHQSATSALLAGRRFTAACPVCTSGLSHIHRRLPCVHVLRVELYYSHNKVVCRGEEIRLGTQASLPTTLLLLCLLVCCRAEGPFAPGRQECLLHTGLPRCRAADARCSPP